MQPNIQQFDKIFKFFLESDENNRFLPVYFKAETFVLHYVDTENKRHKNSLLKISEMVSTMQIETGGELNSVISALLYVLVTDLQVPIKEVEMEFGSDISAIVSGTEKLKQLKFGKIHQNADNYIKLALTYVTDIRSMLVRLAEIVYRLRHLNDTPPDAPDIFINNISMLYAPVAHRLGLYKIKTEFEEAVMRYEAPEMYAYLNEKLKSSKESREKYIESFTKPIKKKLDDAGFKYTIKGRTKAISSIWSKIQNQGVGFEKVKDIFAIRIILDSPRETEKADCWNVYSIITDMYTPDARRMRDWISLPRSSGYESLHATILGPGERWVEVQIRTERMDEIAENGPAAHWRYKEKGKSESSQWLAHMRNAIENPDLFTTDEELLQKTQSKEIFIFTPAGELRKVEKGYTVLDFAYMIHSNIGETCTGAEVDGQFKPISYVLQNGQTVKIKTSKSQTPNDEWLNILKSPKSRLKLKRTLKAIQYKYADLGKEIVKKKLEQLEITFDEVAIDKLTAFFHAKHPLELYHLFGEGKLSPTKIKPVFEAEIPKTAAEIAEVLPEEIHDITPSGGDFILIDKNLSTIDYQFAKCCNPVPGDKIFGFVTVSKGTKIHKESCPNALDLKERYAYRVIPAKWNVAADSKTGFIAEFQLSGEDKNGLTAEITNLISNELSLKLRSISISANKKNQFNGKIGVELRNQDEIQRVIEALRKKSYIHNITRS